MSRIILVMRVDVTDMTAGEVKAMIDRSRMVGGADSYYGAGEGGKLYPVESRTVGMVGAWHTEEEDL